MKTWAITGANRGIGLELTKALTARGDKVLAICRKASPELAALTNARIIEGVDVAADPEGVADKIGDVAIDVLVNNAGILEADALGSFDVDSLRRQLEVNTLGPLRLTRALLPRIGKGGKVAVITSRMGSIGDNGSGGYYGYRMSKAAVNAAFVSLARDLAPRGIAVSILHPGMVATEMTGEHGIPPADSAKGLIARIDELDAGKSGKFLHQNGEELPW
jgi:NAD(P)-dependent dehydrogenase (short-subunit alcohol dehydrogenase family)